MSTPLILSIETATLAGSVSVSKGAQVIATVAGDKKVSHSNTLLVQIEQVLSESGYSLQDVDVFAVALGPGSFTGLRIGLATAKALAFTLRKPIIGIPTLEAVAHTAGNCRRTVALLPAGRGEVFVQMFDVSPEKVRALDAAVHINPEDMLRKYAGYSDICWCGEGAHLHREKIEGWADKSERRLLEIGDAVGWSVVPNTSGLAEHVAAIASLKHLANDFQTPEALSAIYVRPSDAELKSQPS